MNQRERIIASLDVFNVSLRGRKYVMEALDSKEWNWQEDCDGCTFISENWEGIYPPCLVHDYMWITGRGGYQSDLIFLDLMLEYKLPKLKAYFRFFAVRLAWVLYYKKIR